MKKILLFVIAVLPLLSCGSFTPKDPEVEDLMGKTWILTNIGSIPAQKGVEVSLVFVSENELSGYTGCNEYNSDYSFNAGSFSVSGITASTDSCAESVMDQEANYIITLEGAESVKLYGKNLVINSNEIFQKLKFSPR